MKKKLLFISLSILLGMLFTFFVLNKENTYAKEEYLVYAFQTGAFNNEENAIDYKNQLSSAIILKENNLYKVYVAIYKDIDIINKMLVYFENNNINIYLKSLSVSKEFYNNLGTYEELLKNSENDNVYSKINLSILNNYLESLNNE